MRYFLFFILITIFGVMAVDNAYSLRTPTKAQLDKYCIAVQLDVDNQIHYFAIQTIKDFNDKGFTVIYGKYGEGRNFIPKESILNWDIVKAEYKRKR